MKQEHLVRFLLLYDGLKKRSRCPAASPCPEFTFLGLDRPSMTYEEYNNEEYRTHCRKILLPIIEQLKEYTCAGYEIVGSLAIQSSPSCDPTRGVYMEELHRLLKKHNIHLQTQWYLPNDEIPVFDGEKHYLRT